MLNLGILVAVPGNESYRVRSRHGGRAPVPPGTTSMSTIWSAARGQEGRSGRKSGAQACHLFVKSVGRGEEPNGWGLSFARRGKRSRGPFRRTGGRRARCVRPSREPPQLSHFNRAPFLRPRHFADFAPCFAILFPFRTGLTRAIPPLGPSLTSTVHANIWFSIAGLRPPHRGTLRTVARRTRRRGRSQLHLQDVILCNS
jgi:hypothetical protein